MNTLRQVVQDYLNLRLALGFKLKEADKALHDFVTFMEQSRASYITQSLALEWAQQCSNPATGTLGATTELGAGVRALSQCYRSTHSDPAQGLLPFRPKRARPYLYSDDEIRSLLQAALQMPYRYERGALLPWTYHCLFGLLSVSGMRLGEVRNLELKDVDLTAAVLTIRGAKFGKSRLVPLHDSTREGACRLHRAT